MASLSTAKEDKDAVVFPDFKKDAIPLTKEEAQKMERLYQVQGGVIPARGIKSGEHDVQGEQVRSGVCNKCMICVRYVKTCTRCKSTRYCSKECQKDDWKRHKAECTQIIEAKSHKAPERKVEVPKEKEPEMLKRNEKESDMKCGVFKYTDPEGKVCTCIISKEELLLHQEMIHFTVQAVRGMYITVYKKQGLVGLQEALKDESRTIVFLFVKYINAAWHRYNKGTDAYFVDTINAIKSRNVIRGTNCILQKVLHLGKIMIRRMSDTIMSCVHRNLDTMRNSLSTALESDYNFAFIEIHEKGGFYCRADKPCKDNYDGRDLISIGLVKNNA